MPNIQEENFGATNDGTRVYRYLLRNGDIEIAVITWGAVVQSVRVPDRTGGRRQGRRSRRTAGASAWRTRAIHSGVGRSVQGQRVGG